MGEQMLDTGGHCMYWLGFGFWMFQGVEITKSLAVFCIQEIRPKFS